jgi:hypothetical protein
MVYNYGVAVEPMTQINRQAAELHEHGEVREIAKPAVPDSTMNAAEQAVEPDHNEPQHDHEHQHNHSH